MANFTVNNISVVGMAVVVPENKLERDDFVKQFGCLLYTSPSPRDA